MQSELARTTAVLPRPCVPAPSDFLHVTGSVKDCVEVDSKIHKEEKAAQRGPLVAQAYLEALLTKASQPCSEHAPDVWIQPGDETWVIDLTAWAGGRGLASLNLMDNANAYGRLKHVFVAPGYKRLGHGADFAHQRCPNEVANP